MSHYTNSKTVTALQAPSLYASGVAYNFWPVFNLNLESPTTLYHKRSIGCPICTNPSSKLGSHVCSNCYNRLGRPCSPNLDCVGPSSPNPNASSFLANSNTRIRKWGSLVLGLLPHTGITFLLRESLVSRYKLPVCRHSFTFAQRKHFSFPRKILLFDTFKISPAREFLLIE